MLLNADGTRLFLRDKEPKDGELYLVDTVSGKLVAITRDANFNRYIGTGIFAAFLAQQCPDIDAMIRVADDRHLLAMNPNFAKAEPRSTVEILAVGVEPNAMNRAAT